MIALTNEQWETLTAKLDRILAEQMMRQKIDADFHKRLTELEHAIKSAKQS